MKFDIYLSSDGWRFTILGANNRTIATGEAYERPQMLVKTLNTYFVRGDEKLALRLTKALGKNGLDPSGKQILIPVDTADGMVWKTKAKKK